MPNIARRFSPSKTLRIAPEFWLKICSGQHDFLFVEESVALHAFTQFRARRESKIRFASRHLNKSTLNPVGLIRRHDAPGDSTPRLSDYCLHSQFSLHLPPHRFTTASKQAAATGVRRIAPTVCRTVLRSSSVTSVATAGFSPSRSMADNPIEQRPLKADVVTGFLAFNPFVLQDLFPLGEKLPVQPRLQQHRLQRLAAGEVSTHT
jgi:hypothetical protein